MAEQVEILRIEVDNESAQKALVNYEQRLVALKKEQSEFRKALIESNGTNKQAAEGLVRVTKEVQSNNQKRRELTKSINTESNSLQALRNNLAKTVNLRNNINTATAEGRKRFNDLTKSIKEQTESIKQAEQAGGDFRRNVGNYTSALDGVPGPIGLVIGSIKKMTLAAKAFIATPLGLIIAGISAAIGTLIAYFKSSEEGQAALNKVTKVFSVILGNLSDILASVGKAIFDVVTNPKQAFIDLGNIIKENIINRFEAFGKIGQAVAKIFSKDWKEGLQDLGDATIQLGTGIEDFTEKAVNGFNSAKGALTGLIDETKRETAEAKRLADLELETNRLERKQLVETAKVEAQVAELRRKAREENEFSASERLAFLDEANKLQEGLLATDIKIAENRLELQRIQNSFSKSTQENLDAEAQRVKELFDIQTRRETERKQILREQNTVRKQAQAERAKEIQQTQEELKAESDFLAELDQIEIENEQKVADELAKINEQKRKDDQETAQKQVEIAKLKNDAVLGANENLLASGASLLKEGGTAFKAASASEAGISTYKAITKTLAEPTLPFPSNVITSIAIGAQGFANVAKILGFNFAGGGRIGNRGFRVKPDGRGDNRLILAKDTETILNSRQASKIGAANLKRAGVPGFADGGAVNLSGSIPSDVLQANLIGDMLMRMPSPIVTVKDYSEVAKRVEVKEMVSSL